MTDTRILEMFHRKSSQGNESLNMRIAEVAPKSCNFSRTNSLYYRVCYVVGVHNLKNFDFHKRVMSKMHVSEMNSVLKGFLTKRDAEAARKETRDCTI